MGANKSAPLPPYDPPTVTGGEDASSPNAPRRGGANKSTHPSQITGDYGSPPQRNAPLYPLYTWGDPYGYPSIFPGRTIIYPTYQPPPPPPPPPPRRPDPPRPKPPLAPPHPRAPYPPDTVDQGDFPVGRFTEDALPHFPRYPRLPAGPPHYGPPFPGPSHSMDAYPVNTCVEYDEQYSYPYNAAAGPGQYGGHSTAQGPDAGRYCAPTYVAPANYRHAGVFAPTYLNPCNDPNCSYGGTLHIAPTYHAATYNPPHSASDYGHAADTSRREVRYDPIPHTPTRQAAPTYVTPKCACCGAYLTASNCTSIACRQYGDDRRVTAMPTYVNPSHPGSYTRSYPQQYYADPHRPAPISPAATGYQRSCNIASDYPHLNGFSSAVNSAVPLKGYAERGMGYMGYPEPMLPNALGSLYQNPFPRCY